MARIILSMLIFGTIGLFVRYAPLPSSLLALVRGYIGSLFLAGFLLITHRKIQKQALRQNLKLLVLSGMAIGVNWILLFESYHYTSVAVATLCYYMQPVFVTLAAPLVLKERITLKQKFCVLVTFLGMVLTCGLGEGRLSGPFGIALALAAALFYATAVLLNKKLSPMDPYSQTIVQLTVASTTVLPYVLVSVDFQTVAFNPLSLGILLLVGIVHTGIAYLLFFSATGDVAAHRVAILSYIDPITALLLSALVLKEPLTLLQGFGALLVLGSTLFSQLSAADRHPGESRPTQRT